MIPEPDVKPGKAQLKDEHPPQKEQPAPILSGALEFFSMSEVLDFIFILALTLPVLNILKHFLLTILANEQTNKGMEPLEQSDAEQVHVRELFVLLVIDFL